MSIAAIRTRLEADLKTINSVVKVFKNEPNIAPANADCPCFVLSYRDPACFARSDTNSSIEYTWQFDVMFLYKPEGLGNLDENMSALETYIKLFVDKLSANVTGGGAWRDWNKDTGTLTFTTGILTREGASAPSRYYGWQCDLDITESVSTTFSAGA